MKSLSKIQKTFTEILESSADIEIPAFLGNLQGVISADKKGSVYVVVQGVGIELIVKNNKVPQKYRWPVIVGKDKTDGTLRILRERNSFFEPEYIDIQDHSSTQQWPARDTLFVRPEQILPGLVVPTANSMTIDFVGFIYHYNGWHVVDNETIDLTFYIPSTEANWLLAQVDDTETISYVAGASVAGRELLLPSDIPAADIGNRPLFAIKMYAGQSQIVQTKTTTDIADLRWAGWLPIPATTAANDFQVGDGSGNWIKKTLAETITILRSSLDSIFAPIAKGVTNGDSHDHNGGDGGTIAYSSLSGTPTITNPPATTAANDFQVGNGSGNWIKKTLAETITILRSSLDSIYPATSAVVPVNGWIPAGATWTRTGNHSFTVSGDVTSDYRYKKGNWVRYKDGVSYEYGIIWTTSYSAPNTTINLLPNTTHAMAATTITDNYTSNVINPDGAPVYLSSTPTVAGLTTPVYNSQVARFSNMGNGSLFYAARIDITSWAGQTGFIRFVLPADAVFIAGGNYGVGSYYRNGTSAQQGTHALIPLSTTELGMATNDAASAVSWEASARVVITCSIVYNF